MAPSTVGLSAAAALCRTLSNQLTGPLQVTFGPPCYKAAEGVLQLPAMPTLELSAEELLPLRAALSQGAGRRALNDAYVPTDAHEAVLLESLQAVRAGRWIDDEYPGAAQTLHTVLQGEAAQLRTGAIPLEPSAAAIGTFVQHALQGTLTLPEAASVYPEFAPWLHQIQAMLPELASQLDTDDHTHTAAQRLRQTLVLPPPPPKPQPMPCDNGQDQCPTNSEAGQPSDAAGERATARPQGQGADTGQRPEPPSQPPQPQPQSGSAPSTVATPTAPAPTPLPVQTPKDAQLGPQRWLQDAAQHTGAIHQSNGPIQQYLYRTDFDRIEIPSLGANNAAPRLTSELRQVAQQLELTLRQLFTLPTRSWATRQVAGRFDPRRITALLEDHPDVFRRRRKLDGIQVAVSLVVDESGSMSSYLETVRSLLYVFNQALGRLDVPFEIVGWTDAEALPVAAREANQLYRTRVMRYRLLKQFSDPWSDRDTWRRLRLVAADGATPMAEGLLFGAERLLRRPEPHKLLFFLSDGRPEMNARGPHEVHERFLRDIVARTQRSGIELIGVGLQSNLTQWMPHAVQVDASTLRSVVQRELLKAVRAQRAAWRRRTA